MVCNSLSSVLNNLKGVTETSKYKENPLLGESNNILDPIAFDKFNEEFTRYIELKYKINTKGELAFSKYETETKFPYTSRFYRDDIQTTIYAQANTPLFEAMDDERIKAEIKEELQDYDILNEPESEFPEDESLNPMYMRGNVDMSGVNREFQTKFRTAMIKFMKGLNIEVDENANEIIPLERRTYRDVNGNTVVKEDPMTGFDLLQKFLRLKENISDKDLAKQNAYIILTFLGKQSVLGIELWKGINSWSKYQEVYDKYNQSKYKEAAEKNIEKEAPTYYGEKDVSAEIVEKVYEFDPTRFNSWAHRQTIIEFIAEMLRVGIDNDYTGKKRENPDLNKAYFESLGYRDKYAKNWIVKMFNKIWNWIQENIKNNKAITIYTEPQLMDTVMDIVDDVYKQKYNKFIRSYYEDPESGKFFSSKGEEFEQKYYEKSLEKDSFAKYIVEKLFNSPFDYKLSGSLVLRLYGRVLRAISEDLHDIDGVVTLKQFLSEANHEKFLKWIQERGLPLSKDRNSKNSKQFLKEITPLLEGQSWYQDLKKLFPSWTLTVSFIGRDHKKGESITISGYIEHPTETVLVENADGTASSMFFKPSDNGKVLPKRYVLDFFLRTDKGNYPEVFDEYYKDWKQIFEAKINMGRGKDLADLIYFQPFRVDKYKFTNRGFRYFTYANDKYDSIPDPVQPSEVVHQAKTERAKEAASALALKLATNLGVDYMNVTEEQARQILESRQKPYNGEPAFYFAGTVYTVGDNVNFDTVLHEFSHPFLRAIAKENPELFYNLYQSLVTSNEGKIIREHVLENYPELSEYIIDKEGERQLNPLFMEEVLAYGLQKRAVNKVTDQIATEGFDSFISSILNAIKNFFKKIFGSKAKVADIDVDTKLTDLAEKLLGDTFEFETDLVSEEDIVSWARNIKEMAQKLTQNAKADDIQDAINEMYTTTQLIISKAENFRTRSPLYQKMLREALFEKGSTQLIKRIKSSLQGFQNIQTGKNFTVEEAIQNTLDAEKLRQTELANGARSFVNTVSIANNIAKNIFQDLDAMQRSKSFDSRDAVALLFLYRSSIRTWNDMFENFDEMLLQQEDFDINEPNDLVDLMNEVKNNLLRADNKIKDIYKENAVNFYVEVTGYMNDFLMEELGRNLKSALTDKLTDSEIEDFYNKIITKKINPEDEEAFYKMLEGKGILDKYIRKFVEDYKKFEMNQDKITDGLSGKLKDVSWFNRFFESYTSSNDPIVGGLAIFINDQHTEASNNALEKSYRFRQKLEKILPRINYNTLNTRQLLDMVMFKDKVMYVDKKTKEVSAREVFTFLNEWKDYRYNIGKLQYELDKAMAGEDREAQIAAANALAKYNKDYMWDDYLPEVYEKDKIFDKYGEVGKAAWLARKMALDAYNNEANEISDELERFQKYSTLQALWKNYKSLFSYKYDDGVTDKVDDPENGIYDLSIAKILNEHREASKDYYEFEPREGSLQTAFNQFLSLQEMKNLSPEQYEKEKQEWIKQNTRTAFEQEYYDSRKDLIARLKTIQDKINKAMSETFDISGAFDEIYNLMYAYKDEQGQPIPSELGVDKMRRIKELNQKIIDYKAGFDKATGLTTEELDELDLYIAMAKKDPAKLNQDQKNRLRDLLEKQAESGLSLDELATLQGIYAELSSLTQKVATEYYVDSLNEHLQRMEVEPIAAEQVDNFINSDELAELVRSDGKFATWFKLNHVSKKIKKNFGKKIEIQYERTMANSVSLPKNPDYIKTTKLMNEITGKEETIYGVPNARHSVYRVKKKYRTGYNSSTGEIELKVGVHIDNKGDYLPRPYAPGDKNSAVDGSLVNEEYLRVKNAGGARAEFLELLKEAHLSFQEGKANSSKLYLDMPRYVMRDTLSRIQAGKFGDRARQIKEGAKQYITDRFGKAVDEVNLEHNYDRDNNLEEYRLVNTDLNSQEVSYVPVSGIYNLEIDNVDPDVLQGMFKYLLSLETQSKLLETLPLVNSILDTLEDPKNAPKTVNTYSKTIKKVKGKLQATTKPGASNNRAGQVRSLIEREYHGVQFSGEGSSVYLDKVLNQIQKFSARASLAINLPSDLKNRYGQIVQNIIESAGKEFITVKDLAQARLWAATTMIEWTSKSVYTKGVPALSSQLIEMFDSAFKFEDNFGRSVSRNLAKDMLNGTWMYDIRKNLEMEASLQLFGAFLNAEKVEQTLSNGKTITINYKDAWQINKDTGIAELKPGIDPAYANRTIYHEYVKGETLEQIAERYHVSVEDLQKRNKVQTALEFSEGEEIVIAKSEKFKRFRNKFQGVSHRLYGSYDRFAQAEGNKYVPYRAFMFMRKWFTPMFVNRFGASVNVENGLLKPKFEKRYDWMLGKPTIGFYINAYLGLKDLVGSKFKGWSYMPEDQKRDLMRVMVEGLKVIGLALLAGMMFDYDPDDKERFKKMRARSGTFGTDQFNTWGFMQNQMLILMLGVQAETSAFIPLPTIGGINFGGDDYIKLLTTTSSAFGNTIGLYFKIMQDIANLLTGSDKAYYMRKEGDYFWQDQGAPKIIGHLLRTVGVSGSTGDTAQALENLENAGKIK